MQNSSTDMRVHDMAHHMVGVALSTLDEAPAVVGVREEPVLEGAVHQPGDGGGGRAGGRWGSSGGRAYGRQGREPTAAAASVVGADVHEAPVGDIAHLGRSGGPGRTWISRVPESEVIRRV